MVIDKEVVDLGPRALRAVHHVRLFRDEADREIVLEHPEHFQGAENVEQLETLEQEDADDPLHVPRNPAIDAASSPAACMMRRANSAAAGRNVPSGRSSQ